VTRFSKISHVKILAKATKKFTLLPKGEQGRGMKVVNLFTLFLQWFIGLSTGHHIKSGFTSGIA